MSTASPPARSARPWYAKKRYVVPIAVLLTLSVVGSVGEEEPDPATPAAPSSAASTADDTASDADEAAADRRSDERPDPEIDGTASTPSRPARVEQADARPRAGGAATAEARAKVGRTYVVSRVVDGDTVELRNGEQVRVVGIDTPERGECGYDSATVNMERLVLGRRVRLAPSDEDRDRYGRLLRFVDVGMSDAGLRQIRRGLAIARYDSRDGYGEHPREARYISADRDSANAAACPPKPEPTPTPTARPEPRGGCAPGYTPCLPVVGDLDCADVDGPIHVTGADPYGLDREDDGVGCE